MFSKIPHDKLSSPGSFLLLREKQSPRHIQAFEDCWELKEENRKNRDGKHFNLQNLIYHGI